MRLAKITVKPGKFNPHIKEFRHYYHVHIFDSKQDMWCFGAKLSPWEKDQNGGWGAITIPEWREKLRCETWVKAPKIGNVLFCQDLLGSECITHEAVHMATSYLRICDRLVLNDQIDEHEEKLAYYIGSCTRQIVDSLYKLEIL